MIWGFHGVVYEGYFSVLYRRIYWNKRLFLIAFKQRVQFLDYLENGENKLHGVILDKAVAQ